MITKKNSLKALAVAIASTTAIPALAVDSSVRLVNVALQDEARRLPADNSVLFTAANRRVSIALDVLAAGGDSSKLAGTMVTVVDATGNARKFAADNTGVVTIDDAKAGPHAVVASTDTAHGSSLFVFEEQAPAAADVAAAPARMTMLDISGEGLLPLINDYLGETEDSPFADDLGQVKAQTGAAFGYQVALGAGGVLRGQVITVANGQASLAGTTVTIFKNGQPVARDVTDADGSFEMTGVREGIHGLVAAGPAGYSAFAFEALPADGLTQLSTRSEMFVTKMNQAASVLPVVLIPTQMVPAVVSSIRSFYPPMAGGAGGVAGGAGAAAAAGAAAFGSAGAMGAGQPLSSGGMAGGGGGGFGGGAAGAAGGAGGLGALASLGAIGAAVAVAADEDDEPGNPVSPFAVPVVNPGN